MVAEDEDDGDVEGPARPFELAVAVGVFANFVGNVARSVSVLAEDVAAITRSHSVYAWQRKDAYGRMQLELESLPTTE